LIFLASKGGQPGNISLQGGVKQKGLTFRGKKKTPFCGGGLIRGEKGGPERDGKELREGGQHVRGNSWTGETFSHQVVKTSRPPAGLVEKKKEPVPCTTDLASKNWVGVTTTTSPSQWKRGGRVEGAERYGRLSQKSGGALRENSRLEQGGGVVKVGQRSTVEIFGGSEPWRGGGAHQYTIAGKGGFKRT